MDDEPNSDTDNSKKSCTIRLLEEINSKNIFNKFDECPLLYQNCTGKDSTCIGDITKFKGCNLFFEKYLTAPPARYKLRQI